MFGRVGDRDFDGTSRSAGGPYLGVTVKLNDLFRGFGLQPIPKPQETPTPVAATTAPTPFNPTPSAQPSPSVPPSNPENILPPGPISENTPPSTQEISGYERKELPSIPIPGTLPTSAVFLNP
jgi:hypothetical protein